MCNSMQPCTMTLLDTMQFVEVPIHSYSAKMLTFWKGIPQDKMAYNYFHLLQSIQCESWCIHVLYGTPTQGRTLIFLKRASICRVASPQTGRLLMRIWRLLVKSSAYMHKFLKCTRSFIHRYSGAQFRLGPCTFICYIWQSVNQITAPFLELSN